MILLKDILYLLISPKVFDTILRRKRAALQARHIVSHATSKAKVKRQKAKVKRVASSFLLPFAFLLLPSYGLASAGSAGFGTSTVRKSWASSVFAKTARASLRRSA